MPYVSEHHNLFVTREHKYLLVGHAFGAQTAGFLIKQVEDLNLEGLISSYFM
jgi:hypothetical protein